MTVEQEATRAPAEAPHASKPHSIKTSVVIDYHVQTSHIVESALRYYVCSRGFPVRPTCRGPSPNQRSLNQSNPRRIEKSMSFTSAHHIYTFSG